MEIDATLVRERFIIEGSISCPSTRMKIELPMSDSPPQTYVIRSYNMQSTVRMFSQMIKEHTTIGPLMNRVIPLDWGGLWHKSISNYERKYINNTWVSIYHNGKIIFSYGEHHPFLDLIEQCNIANKGDYESSVNLAGTEINLHYDRNVALIVDLNTSKGRCSLVLRGSKRTTTFNYSIKLKDNDEVNIQQILNMTADFFEGVQLSFIVGSSSDNMEQEEDKQLEDAKKRVDELNIAINIAEKQYVINYRPERPSFYELIEFAQDTGEEEEELGN